MGLCPYKTGVVAWSYIGLSFPRDVLHRCKRVLNEVGLDPFDGAVSLETQMQTAMQAQTELQSAPST